MWFGCPLTGGIAVLSFGGVPNWKELVMRRRSHRLSMEEREEHVAKAARDAAETALCHLGYLNRSHWTDERFEAERELLAGVLARHLKSVDIRQLLGTPVPPPVAAGASCEVLRSTEAAEGPVSAGDDPEPPRSRRNRDHGVEPNPAWAVWANRNAERAGVTRA